jgi:hypothetical protein
MNIDLPNDSALDARAAAAIKTFNEKLAELRIEHCPGCREEGFHIKLSPQELCSRCSGDTTEPRRWSDENNMNPSTLVFFLTAVVPITHRISVPQLNIPPCLKYLTEMEEMLIARTKTIMQVRWTKGRQLCYKDHIVNLPQNITEIATKLPRLPEDIDMVIIRRDDVDLTHHVDYMVRRDKVRAALAYKIANDPDYTDLGAPDEEALTQLPENGTVVDRIPVCREGSQADGAPQPAGPTEAAGGTSGDDDGGVFVGGVLDLGNGPGEEVVEVRNHANRIIGGPQYQQTVVGQKPIFISMKMH